MDILLFVFFMGLLIIVCLVLLMLALARFAAVICAKLYLMAKNATAGFVKAKRGEAPALEGEP